MIVCQFNLSSQQIQILTTFRVAPDSRLVEHHGFHEVAGPHCVSHMKKLCREGYLDWFDGSLAEGRTPGYVITSKGEMMLRVIEDELKRSLGWFGGESVPHSQVNSGAMHDLAAGKSEVNAKGKIRRKKIA